MTATLNWQSVLAKLVAREDLTRAEAAWSLEQIMSGTANDGIVAAFMVTLRTKGESVEEISGLVDAMLLNAIKLATGSNAVDIVGTGGDMFGTVNISSMASIVTAACGVPVLKHGSRSASGRTGSSEMLEKLGIRLDLDADGVAQVFDQAGITFFFAPVFHPAMKYVAPIRKLLGVPTTFNFLGPLANPAQPIATSLGVSNAAVAPLMAAELAARGRTALVFRSSDGLDELSTTASNHIWQVSGGKVTEFDLNATDIGLEIANIEQLIGGDAEFNAQVVRDLLAGDRSANLAAIADVVALNAAGGIVAYRMARDSSLAEISLIERMNDALAETKNAIESGAAQTKLQQWISASN